MDFVVHGAWVVAARGFRVIFSGPIARKGCMEAVADQNGSWPKGLNGHRDACRACGGYRLGSGQRLLR
ncbi:MAG: hypothetical protein EBT47_10630, partial [Chloroflexi bacterium]|nr:hypothetical protein [Chloroflexota bacterium]